MGTIDKCKKILWEIGIIHSLLIYLFPFLLKAAQNNVKGFYLMLKRLEVK